MYEEITYEQLLQGMLNYAVSQAAKRGQKLDTREGSMLWYGQAPAAVEGQNLYIQLDTILNETFADTASRPYLMLRAAERGLSPDPATKAVWRGEFTPAGLNLAPGTRFNISDLNYTVVSKIQDGAYRLECETPGSHGNDYSGTMVPIEYIQGLQTAQLTELLIPGEDEQDTESFRQEYFDSFDAQAFGGNVADYRQKIGDMNGVGGVKVYRAWNGNIRPSSFLPPASYDSWYASVSPTAPEEIKAWLSTLSAAARDGLLTVGGTVRVVIIDSTFGKPSGELVSQVQTAVDPEQNHGEGMGFAPIGHYVTVRGVEETQIDIATKLTFDNGWTWSDVETYAREAVEGYLLTLSKSWADSDQPLVVRVSGIETALLTCPHVIDVQNTAVNGAEQNLTLDQDAIPALGSMEGLA